VPWRRLRRVSNVDVGAQHPTGDSVTRAFYDHGWRGINIEPSPGDFAGLAQERPGDVNLNLAIAEQPGQRSYYEVLGTGLGTLDPELAERHRDAGFAVVTRTVQVRTLTEICDTHGVTEIHFLKIDVEGAEAAVLAGFNLSRYRPWLVVVEATAPNSTEQTHDKWAWRLSEAGYRLAFFDGLNQYYVAPEHGELMAFFDAPPNVFDHYVRYSEWQVVQTERHWRLMAQRVSALRAHETRSFEEQMVELRQWAESTERYAKELERKLAR